MNRMNATPPRNRFTLAGMLAQREMLLLAAVIILLGAIATRFPSFLLPGNLANVFNDTAILLILVIGQMVVILTRAIDLSTAANLALTGMICALLNAAYPDLPLAALILVAALSGLVLGAINGLLVWKLGMPSIVVTLGTLTIYRGLAFLISGGRWVNAHEMSASFLGFPRAEIFGLPVLSWLSLIVLALAWFGFKRLTVGRDFYAVGGNPTAAVYVGIDVGRTRFIAFCLAGLLSGISGYLWVSRYAVAYVDIANGFELDVIAACVIGGISIAGGIGSVGGAILGALFLGIIKNALPVINVSPFWQMAISGAIIIIAVIINVRAERSQGRRILRQPAPGAVTQGA
ncbi:MAG TPA: ABC transporter permease [Terriglobales bacterium]|nr:ABC transporter permease [Terriglobales bacterium]